KHYYYYVRGLGGSQEESSDLTLAREMLYDVMNSTHYKLIEPIAGATQLDYINAVLCNTSYMDLPASDGSFYRSENNDESVWEVLYSDERINQVPGYIWTPGWQWSGTLNFQWFYHHETSYKNHEAHPDMYYAFEEVTEHPAGFTRDPRTHASLYIDGERLHFVQGEEYYDRFYTSGINNKRVAYSRGLNYPNQPTLGFGLKKYAYPTYNDKIAPNDAPFNHRVIRLADVMLMYAEVMYLLGDDGSGLNALNAVRARVGMPPVPELTTEAIIHERDVELAFEGFRYLDIVRWSFDPEWGIIWDELEWGINEANSVNPFVVGKNEFLPIPIREINLSQGVLKQNSGW
ncbi:MAG: RagB/SusD family nutrient uptake outer membrane protein, partial [Bacteroidales bacterium]|nr:RagB/SusD family nutrient uptake outer membrane protein [Bacteroidales bacterium]